MSEIPLLDRSEVRALVARAYSAGLDRHMAGRADLPTETAKVDQLTDAVVKLAKPMPTSEAIEQRVRRIYIDGGAHITHAQEAASEIAAAVLALLNGAES